MIKIAFVIDTIESPTAGTEKQLLMLIKHLDRSRFHPILCVLRSSRWLEDEFDLCPLHLVGIESFKSFRGWMAVIRFSRFLSTEGVRIVQTHFRDSSIAGILAARMAGVAAIVGTRRNQGYWYNTIELGIQKFLNRWVSVFVANAESTRQWAARIEGIDPCKIRVVYNGVNLERFYKGTEQQCRQFRKNLGFAEDSLVVGIVANLRPVKAIDTFIKAAGEIVERCTNVNFIIVGDGPERARLEQFSAECGTEPFVRFLGKRVDIPELLSCIDVGVLSSDSESFSNSIVEYMAASLPVVCTDAGGAREAVCTENGFVVNPGDWTDMGKRIVEVIHSDRRLEMGQASRRRSMDVFSVDSMIRETQNIYYTLQNDGNSK